MKIECSIFSRGNVSTPVNNSGGLPEIINAFFGATPQHPFIAEMLKLQFHHVQISQYAGTALNCTGLMVLGAAWRAAEKKNTMNATTNIVGKYNITANFFDLNDEAGIQHKCTEYGSDQVWEEGNIYWKMYRERNLYCEDSATIYESL